MSKSNGKIERFRPKWTKPSPRSKALAEAAKAKRDRERFDYLTRTAQRQVDKNFYSSSAWINLRDYKLCLNPCCEECEAKGVVTLAAHVHHVKERKQFPDLALDLDNLQSVCKACHNAKRRKQIP